MEIGKFFKNFKFRAESLVTFFGICCVFFIIYYTFCFNYFDSKYWVNFWYTVSDCLVVCLGLMYFFIFLSTNDVKTTLKYIRINFFICGVYVIINCYSIFILHGLLDFSFNIGLVSFFVSSLKVRIFLGTFFAFYFLVLYVDGANSKGYRLEFILFVLLLFWLFSISLMCSDLFLLWMLMEGFTIVLVLITAMYTVFSNLRAIKVVLQFFFFNIIFSIFFLLGISFLLFVSPNSGEYTINYWSIERLFLLLNDNIFYSLYLSYYIQFIIIIFLSTFLFKITAAPLAQWVIEVYSALDVVLLMLLLTVYKMIYGILFIKIFIYCLGLIPVVKIQLMFFVFIVVVPSLLTGLWAVTATNLRTVVAFTTVSQFGLILTGFSVDDVSVLKVSLIYFFVYLLQMIGFIAIVFYSRVHYYITNLRQIALLQYFDSFLYFSYVIMLLSFAGFPPLAGFFIKYLIFLRIYHIGYYTITIIGLIVSIVLAFIYIRIAFNCVFGVSGSRIKLFEYNRNKNINQVNSSNDRFYRFSTRIIRLFIQFMVFFNCFFIFIYGLVADWFELFTLQLLYGYEYRFKNDDDIVSKSLPIIIYCIQTNVCYNKKIFYFYSQSYNFFLMIARIMLKKCIKFLLKR